MEGMSSLNVDCACGKTLKLDGRAIGGSPCLHCDDIDYKYWRSVGHCYWCPLHAVDLKGCDIDLMRFVANWVKVGLVDGELAEVVDLTDCGMLPD